MPLALVIDDNEDIAFLVVKALQMDGFEAQMVTVATEAMQWIADTRPDVIFLDLQMPEVTGADILRAIRNDSALSHTKVIVITANHYMIPSVEPLADYIMMKPVSIQQLTDLANRILA